MMLRILCAPENSQGWVELVSSLCLLVVNCCLKTRPPRFQPPGAGTRQPEGNCDREQRHPQREQVQPFLRYQQNCFHAGDTLRAYFSRREGLQGGIQEVRYTLSLQGETH
jgi:hypothetical protein